MTGEKVARRPWQADRAGEKALHYSANSLDVHDFTRPTPACAPVPVIVAGPLWTRPTGGGYAIGRRP
jgi:hypothetical protein